MPLTVRTPTLEVAYEDSGPPDGPPVILLHGFPDDPRAYDGVLPGLVELGCRVLVPWLRGYGATRFLSAATPRSGQQAALGADLRDFMDALRIERACVAGYDWGGRAACIVAALWPQRVRGLVTVGGYNLQDIAVSGNPASAAAEHRLWNEFPPAPGSIVPSGMAASTLTLFPTTVSLTSSMTTRSLMVY